jgi:hypothetical protein
MIKQNNNNKVTCDIRYYKYTTILIITTYNLIDTPDIWSDINEGLSILAQEASSFSTKIILWNLILKYVNKRVKPNYSTANYGLEIAKNHRDIEPRNIKFIIIVKC